MSFEQLVAILRARWLIALATFLTIAGTVAVITLVMPKTYTATGSVVVDIKSPDPIAGMVLVGVAQPSYLMTQMDIITSTRVAQKVVSDLKLDQSPQMLTKWRDSTGGVGDFQAWLAELLRRGLEARPSRGSNVIYLAYKSEDPGFASTVVNGFIKAYLDISVQLRTNPAKQFNEQFESNAKVLRTRLEEAQSRLSAFQQQQGLIVTDERLDVETARLNELSSQLVSLQAAQADSGSRQAAVLSRADQSPDIIANPLISTLKADLVRQEAQLEQLNARYGDRHPQVLELRSSIADLRRKLDTETKRVASSVGVNNSVNTARAAQVKAALDAQRTRVLKMKSIRDEAAIMQREVDSAQRAFDGVMARLQNTELESVAQQTNVAPLELARAPSIPTSPRLLTNIALGTVVAAIAAIALALLIELRDRRLRTISEVEPLLQQAMLGVIPSFKKIKGTSTDLPTRLAPPTTKVKALPHSA